MSPRPARRPAQEYLGTVDRVELNREIAAVLSEGRLHLHPIEQQGQQSRMFPPDGEPRDITCVALTAEFLVYATARGTLTYYYLQDGAIVSEYRHEAPIRNIFTNELGTRLVLVDDAASAYLFNPVNDSALPIPSFSPSATKVLWDAADGRVFVVADARTLSVYTYAPHSLDAFQGAAVALVATSKLDGGATPVLVHDGMLTSQSANGSVSTAPLETHAAIAAVAARGAGSKETLAAAFTQCLAVLRGKRAWEIALKLEQRDLLAQLGHFALHQLDVPLATRVYRELGDAGMVMAMQKLEGVDDAALLAGHVALVCGYHDLAQELFLASSHPISALEMRRDLLDWEVALKLAQTLAPDQVPSISREFAMQLEFREEYEPALAMFNNGLATRDAAQAKACRAGVARMTLRLGDVSRGVQIAMEGDDPQCCRDCAAILEGLKQSADAARLYEEGGQPEKAAALHIRSKNWAAAAPLMARISGSKLHSEFGAAKEAEGRYDEAAAIGSRPKPHTSHPTSPITGTTRRRRRTRRRPTSTTSRGSASSTSTARSAPSRSSASRGRVRAPSSAPSTARPSATTTPRSSSSC